MPEVKAKIKTLRIAPRKVRLVAKIIKGKGTKEALTILKFINKRASRPLIKLINSAIANAANNFNIKTNNFYIKRIEVNEGPKFRRYMMKARGRATLILKRTSHISLILDEKTNKETIDNNQKSITAVSKK